MVGGSIIHNVGFLVKKDDIQLIDSMWRNTLAPVILGYNLVKCGLESSMTLGKNTYYSLNVQGM